MRGIFNQPLGQTCLSLATAPSWSQWAFRVELLARPSPDTLICFPITACTVSMLWKQPHQQDCHQNRVESSSLWPPFSLQRRCAVFLRPTRLCVVKRCMVLKQHFAVFLPYKLQFENWACLDWTGTPGPSIHLLRCSLFLSSLSALTMSASPFRKHADRWARCLLKVRHDCWFCCVRCWRWARSCEKKAAG